MDIQFFKNKLEQELSMIESELSSIASKNPNISNEITDWEAKIADFDVDNADDSEKGDKIEEFEENTAIVKNLEIRYNDIKTALSKINSGQYGLCEVCSSLIEEDRLSANPSAKTCKTHMN